MAINRTETARALAKALAYQDCGKQAAAARWAAILVNLLECEGILMPEHRGLVRKGVEG